MDESRLIGANESDLDDLPLAVVLQIDQLADDFESAWRSGGLPNLDNFVHQLDGASETARAALESHLRQILSELDAFGGMQPDGPADACSSSANAPAAMTPPRMAPATDRPAMMGEYRLMEQLGSGGMGVVYKAEHVRLKRLVAIKFPRFAAGSDRRSAARFLREAHLIGRLTHPHIVRALDAGESEYGPYLVTEFIEGETVNAKVRREGPLEFETALLLTAQAANGLAHAHAQDVVHRDVKPSNLLLDGDGVLRVVDFGLAKLLADDRGASESLHESEQTEFGAFLGTVGYAAPEQLHSDEAVDHRADVYALGCVLYFMLTGEPPHKGTLADRLLARRRSNASSLRLRRSDAPASLEKAWQRMTASSPQHRFATMAEAEHALQAALTEAPNSRERSKLPRRAVLASLACVTLGGLAMWGTRGSRLSPIVSRRTPSGPSPSLAVAPFTAEQAKRHQQAWAHHLGVPVRIVNSAGLPMVLIPAGDFLMGMSDSRLLEPSPPVGDWRFRDPNAVLREQLPRHRVVLTKPIYFGETEVTNGQFRQFVDATGYVTDAERSRGWGREDKGWVKRAGYSWKNLGQRLGEADHPVINVTWNDATALAAWLSSHDSLGAYRLPTEAEWEFACRAGSTNSFFFGDDEGELGKYAWFSANSRGRFQAAGSKAPNPFGIYDMYGNRQEWCLDHYADNYYESSPLCDPVCKSGGSDRVMRGGSHTDLASFCTSARRWFQEAGNPGAAGIRVVCELEYKP